MLAIRTAVRVFRVHSPEMLGEKLSSFWMPTEPRR